MLLEGHSSPSHRDVSRLSFERVRARLPRGGTLPAAEWERRHRALLALLWVSTIATAIYTLATNHYSALHTSAHIVGVAAFGVLAATPRFSHKLRSVFCSLGLLTAAAALIHISGGVIEMHFAFFVFIVALTLYEDWLPFLLAVAYVLVHHGVTGMVDPKSVFNTPDGYAHPWKWAAIHAGFVAMAGATAIVAWRLNENIRMGMRDVQQELHEMAVTDPLTGLANRRRLLAELHDVFERGLTRTLFLFDLNGFKAYNDTFGHIAGDALLVRLARRFEQVAGPKGQVYRLGGDEFCLITPAEGAEAREIQAAALEALSERGKGFAVSAAGGSAGVPRESVNASDALRLADRRMYAEKATGRGSPLRQTRDVLVSALAARMPEIEEHVIGVAELAHAVGTELGLQPEVLARMDHAARLHDIGKLAIPDTIIQTANPLTQDEWDFMQTYTIIGEHILSAAPALADVMPIVRSSHEWYDGTGYPDGLKGEDIPLESRIILVCDAFDAMISKRPYRPSRTREEALAELRRCSGTQFDPAVISVFERAVVRRDDVRSRATVLTAS
jgi:diguanylate cyclase (GGDEF)-like protein